MEQVVLQMLANEIVELVLDEVMTGILSTKCCMWSKGKWKKVMKYLKRRRPERAMRVEELANKLYVAKTTMI